MESPSGNYRPQIIVALIGVAGVLGASLISNWDKITGSRAAVSAPTPGIQPGVATPPRDAVQGLADAQRNSYDSAAGALDHVAKQISAASIPDISGRWRSPEGYSFQIEQNGRAYSYQEYAPNGAWFGSGSGELADRKVKHDFRAPSMRIATGQCSGDVSSDGQSISGSCVDRQSGSSWGFRIDR